MLFSRAFYQLLKPFQFITQKVERCWKQWTKPTTERLLVGTAADLMRSRSELIAENALLRHQLIIYKRQVKQPKLTRQDRGLLLPLASRVKG